MKLVPNTITRSVGRQSLVAQQHAPTILFGVGVIGVVATAVLASKATLKLPDILGSAQAQKDLLHFDAAEEKSRGGNVELVNEVEHKELQRLKVATAMEIGKAYAPAVLAGGISIAALTGSHHILSSRNAALTVAYGALEKGFSEYRGRVVEKYGEDEDRELRYGVEEVEVVDDKGKTKTVRRVPAGTPSIYARFFDETSTVWQREAEYNLVYLRSQQNYLNDLLNARGHVFLNEVYDALGMERSGAGQVVGWLRCEDGDNYIDFGIFNTDNPRAHDFVNGHEAAILLDFNVDGVIYDKLDERKGRNRSW